MPGLIPVIAGVLGIGQSISSGRQQSKALNTQEQIAQQEMADKQQIFKLLQPFFQQYLGAGSPFLSQIQRAGAEQNAQQFNNAAGQVRNTMQTSGLGFGPSGATAAAIGGLGAEAAKGASSTFLDNLLKNEQMKFEAASGLNSLGGMAGSSQNQPNVSIGIQGNPIGNPGSSAMGLSQILQGLISGGGGGGNIWSPSNPGGTLPIGNAPNIPFGIGIGTGGAPTTSGGFGFGPD